MISPKGTVTILFCAFAQWSDCATVSSVLHTRICCCSLCFCLKTNTCHRYPSDTCQLTYCRGGAADECVDEVLMFQTIRLPVLIGIPLFLSSVVICSQELFVVMHTTQSMTIYHALQSVLLSWSKLYIWFASWLLDYRRIFFFLFSLFSLEETSRRPCVPK